MRYLVLFFLAALAVIPNRGVAQTTAKRSTLTPQQLRTMRLHDIDEAIREKSRGKFAGASLPAAIDADRELATSAEVKISASYPESEVHAAVNPADTTNLLVSPIHDGSGTFYMPIYYSKNFGQSWTKSSFSPVPSVTGVQITGGGDPVFAYDANGKAYFVWIDTWSNSSSPATTFGGMYWASSTDKGATWQRAKNSVISTSYTAYNLSTFQIDSTTGFDDKEWIAVDRSNSQYRNTMYVAWTKLTQDSAMVMLARKLPNNDSVETPVRVSSSNLIKVQYTSIGVDANGGVHVTFMGTEDMTTYGIYHAYSADGGKTFGPCVLISPAVIPDAQNYPLFGIRPNGNYPCPHMSIDTAGSGNIYAVWNALGTTDDLGNGTDIYFSYSSDNGLTWSAASIVNTDGSRDYVADHFYPSIAVSGKGTINVTWYDRREDSVNNEIGRYYLGISTNNGLTWSNQPVASKSMNFAHVQDKNGGSTYGFGIGEYTQVLVTPHYTIPVWSDDRTNDGNIRIYASFIPTNDAGLALSPLGVERSATIDGGLSLSATYPNPGGEMIHAGFELDQPSHVTITITDLRGTRLWTLFNAQSLAGQHELSFDASKLANGTYYLVLESPVGYSSRAFSVKH